MSRLPVAKQCTNTSFESSSNQQVTDVYMIFGDLREQHGALRTFEIDVCFVRHAAIFP